MTAAAGGDPFDKNDITLAESAGWLRAASDLDKGELEAARKALEQSARKLGELSRVLARLRERNIRKTEIIQDARKQADTKKSESLVHGHRSRGWWPDMPAIFRPTWPDRSWSDAVRLWRCAAANYR